MEAREHLRVRKAASWKARFTGLGAGRFDAASEQVVFETKSVG